MRNTKDLNNLKTWSELAKFLNEDAAGDTKSTDKWRKVWSVLKNNTKRKAAGIYRAASGTCGEPATKLKLSELEERVLNLVGTQSATGITEAGNRRRGHHCNDGLEDTTLRRSIRSLSVLHGLGHELITVLGGNDLSLLTVVQAMVMFTEAVNLQGQPMSRPQAEDEHRGGNRLRINWASYITTTSYPTRIRSFQKPARLHQTHSLYGFLPDDVADSKLETAALEDDRQEQRKFQSNMREILENNLENISDTKFIKLYRNPKEVFKKLCYLLRQHTNLKSSQRVSLESKVLCALLFYAHGDYQRVVGEANHFSQEAMKCIYTRSHCSFEPSSYRKHFYKVPNDASGTRFGYTRVKNYYYSFAIGTHSFNIIASNKDSVKYQIPGDMGCIDGSHLKIFKPNHEVEHLFYCRKNYHSLNVQMLTKFGGATHDTFIWENSDVNNYIQSLHRSNESSWLLGDSVYPQRPWMMTPYAESSNPIAEMYNKKHSATRIVIENTFGRLKNRWRCVCKDRVLHYKPAKCAQIIIACCILHNIATDFNIPDPEDSEGDIALTDTSVNDPVHEHETNNDLLMERVEH
uniref:SFRICE_008278 n=1 Tax=Spodoptera frugiperda TaxID=7108 RepID=A0A2H1WHW7_SPOFR